MHICTLKDCPRCAGQKLTPVEAQGQVLDTCEKCNGLWFERGELESAWQHAHGALPPGRALLEEEHTAWGEPLPQTGDTAGCPDCGTTLQRHQLSPKFQVEVERCPACQGVWVEDSQRCAIYYAPKVRAALTNISKPTNWPVFLFQLFTRLPVEFNMKPRGRPWVNHGLIILNVFIFLMVIAEESLYLAGGMIPAELMRGQIYTLITYQFQHADLMHIFGNMFFLYLVGDNLEDMMGHYNYLLVYLSGGAFAGLSQWMVDPAGVIPVVGASGSVAALFGIYMIWFRRARLTFMIILYQVKVAPWIFFGVWAVYQIIDMSLGVEGVAYMAHLGGLAFGLAVGWLGYNQVLERNPVLGHINGPYAKILPGNRRKKAAGQG